uniref:E3 SUMO-protein ligase NSE2 n=1 Tax=Oncorhynchus tshawytscha TaxID=74940 RepID=A0AAZ3SLH2_ONCTS
MSLSAVHSTLSSLKTCQTDIGTGMDIVTDVALDVAETAGTENDAVLKKLEVMMLECDVAVTQSEVNFTCPLTQVEMVDPMKNKKCNHHYDRDAIMGMIKARQNQKKKLRCPVVGCGNTDVKQGDLILDQIMKRQILKR